MEALDYPENISEELDILVKKGYYPSKSDLMRDAFRALLNTKAELRVSLAIELYLKEKVSLARAAELAGMTTIEFKEVIAGRGIVRKTEGKSVKEIDKKLKKLGLV
jgi:predicted HTH domain antitoxin